MIFLKAFSNQNSAINTTHYRFNGAHKPKSVEKNGKHTIIEYTMSIVKNGFLVSIPGRHANLRLQTIGF